MVLLNSVVLIGLIPLYLIYTRHAKNNPSNAIKLLYISLVFMFFSAARPAIQNSIVDQKFNSQDFIIALDASYSMQADDLQPSRYMMAKLAIKKLLKLRPKDRFTLFIFTSNALLISPPTTDTSISISALDAINPQYILTKSTNITNLFRTIAKIPLQKKKLIILSDGGDEHDIAKMASIAKNNNIIPYIVATATHNGAALKKDNHYIKDVHSSLVISKINPSLKDLAAATEGKYYELNSLGVIDSLDEDLEHKSTKQEHIKVKSYNELFYIPLSIALLLFFLSITRFGQFFILLPLIFLVPQKVNASVLDFYHIKQAKELYTSSQYKKAAKEYLAVTPSVTSYYNIATSYYKAKEYKSALIYYTRIQTHDAKIKQKILYNIGNCAFKLKRYDRAKEFYLQSLALGDDKDALYNLRLIQKFHLNSKIDPTKMLPNQQKKKEKKEGNKPNAQKKKDTKKSQSGSNTNQSAQESTNGQGSNKKKKKSATISKKSSPKNNYTMGYKAYEIINKGYSDEKEPW